MVQIIAGNKGKGKTKYLLAEVNEEVESANGSVVYIDKNSRHMFELSNKARLINASEFPLRTYNSFIGFVCGIISQDRDLEAIFVDSFLTVAHLEDTEDLSWVISDFEKMGNEYGIRFVLSISREREELPENAQDFIIASP